MSAVHSKSRQTANFWYHLYIQSLKKDIQWQFTANRTSTFRDFIREILRAILQKLRSPPLPQTTVQEYHTLANAFPTQNLSHASIPDLYIIIAPKMQDPATQNIGEYAETLVNNDEYTSLPLNERICNFDIKPEDAIFILYLDHQNSQGYVDQNICPNSFSNNQKKPKKKSKKSHKKPKKSQRKKPKKRSRKRKRKHKKKRRKHSNSHNKNHKKRAGDSDMDTDDMSSSDLSSDYDNYSDEFRSTDDDYLDRTDSEFVPPLKRQKCGVDLNNPSRIKNKLSQRNPTRKRGLISRMQQRTPQRAMHKPRLSNKRRQRLRLNKESNPNHLVFLLDRSRSMQADMMYGYGIDENDSVSANALQLKFVRDYVQRYWRTEGQKTTDISLTTFGGTMDVKANTFSYSASNVKKLVKIVQGLNRENDMDTMATETKLYDALLELISSFKERSMKKYKNTRIVLLTDGENWASKPRTDEVRDALKLRRVTVDCVQITRRERDNTMLKRICTMESVNGRFWNPLTLADWEGILKSIDFLFPFKRAFVFDLTQDSTSSDEEE